MTVKEYKDDAFLSP